MGADQVNCPGLPSCSSQVPGASHPHPSPQLLEVATLSPSLNLVQMAPDLNPHLPLQLSDPIMEPFLEMVIDSPPTCTKDLNFW